MRQNFRAGLGRGAQDEYPPDPPLVFAIPLRERGLQFRVSSRGTALLLRRPSSRLLRRGLLGLFLADPRMRAKLSQPTLIAEGRAVFVRCREHRRFVRQWP